MDALEANLKDCKVGEMINGRFGEELVTSRANSEIVTIREETEFVDNSTVVRVIQYRLGFKGYGLKFSIGTVRAGDPQYPFYVKMLNEAKTSSEARR